MNIRSKLGLSLAGIALAAITACGPKRINTEITSTSVYEPKVEVLFDGQTSKGEVRLTNEPSYFDKSTNNYQLTLDPTNSDTFYRFNDGNASGVLGDSSLDWVMLSKKPGYLAVAEYGINYFVRFKPKPSLIFRKGAGVLADRAVEQSERRIRGEFDTIYQDVLTEIADSLGVDLSR